MAKQRNEDLFSQAPSRLYTPQAWDESRPRAGNWMSPEPEAPGTALFPMLEPAPTGLARMVEDSAPVDEGHLVEFRSLAVRSILNKSVSKRRLWFARTINPYRGCEFACRYCYARYTHEFLELKDPADFERQIFVKQNAAWLLEQELRSLDPSEEIAIGTATDPYQPIERRAEVTRSILEVLSRRSGHRIGIVTKSNLIERDIDLLKKISSRNELVIHLTITTTDTELARKLEPRAPRPDLRFRAVERLRRAGLRTGILCSPLLPGLTDDLKSLDAMARRAKAADASFFSAQPLFLKPCSRPVFLGFIREHYPELEASYAASYDSEAFVGKAYSDRLRDLVHSVTRKHKLVQRTTDAILTREATHENTHGTTYDAVSGPNHPNHRIPAQASLWPALRPATQPPARPAASAPAAQSRRAG
jgi:DNA repair photolyase